MRSLVVASKYLPEYTGAAFRIQNLYKTLRESIDVEVVCGGIEKKNAEEYLMDGINITRLKDLSSGVSNRFKYLVYFYLDFFRAYFYIRNNKFDVLHLIGTSALTAAAYYYAYFHGRPIIIELVTQGAKPIFKLPLLGKFWAPKILKHSVIVAISEPLGKICKEFGFTENVWIRPNPVDTNKFFKQTESKAQIREKLGLFSGEDTLLAMVAKFMPQKNQIFLLDVLANLPQEYKLVLAGPIIECGPLASRDAAYMKSIEDKIIQLDLSARVKIIKGFVQKPQDIINACNIYMMPNINEGLGTPLLEAQACGVPVIANSDEEAFHAHIMHGKNGFLLKLQPELWVEKILDIESLQEAELESRMQFITNNYCSENITKIYVKIILDTDFSNKPNFNTELVRTDV